MEINNQKNTITLIKQFAGQSNVLTIPRVFIDFTGSLETALFLSQAIYWSDKIGDRKWFYKTYQEWQQEIYLSKYQVTKAVKILKEMRILSTYVKKANGNPTVHYQVHFKRLSDRLVKFLTIESQKTSLSLTEITKIDRYHHLMDHSQDEAIKPDVLHAGLQWTHSNPNRRMQ